MGVFRPIVERAQRPPGEVDPDALPPSDRIFTPATGLSATRPILALKAAEMLINEKRGVTPLIAVMAATDMEGVLARFMDKHWPEKGLGVSEFGIPADYIADSSASAIVAGAMLFAPRVSIPGKLAVATILGQEAQKVATSFDMAITYYRETGEWPKQSLVKVGLDGKEAMVEKFGGLILAATTHDLEPGRARDFAGATAVGLAGVGSWRAQKAQEDYAEQFEELMDSIKNQTDSSIIVA